MTILEFLSLRTFSSVWYWIAVAAVWSAASHRPMGVPWDIVAHARSDAEARRALEAVARILARRWVAARGTAFAVALASAALTGLAVLAFVYRIELAQGLVLIAFPLAIVGWLSALTARVIDGGGDPDRYLRRLRASIHAIALVSIFAAAFWGVYVTIAATVL